MQRKNCDPFVLGPALAPEGRTGRAGDGWGRAGRGARDANLLDRMPGPECFSWKFSS